MTDLFDPPGSDRYYDRVLRQIRAKKALRNEKTASELAQRQGRSYTPSKKLEPLIRSGKTPFCGCDCEGGGENERGQQHLRLFRAGEFLLFDDNRPLTTAECLEFICSLPKTRLYVGFAFTSYDGTQILRDLPEKTVTEIFRRQSIDDDGTETRTSEYVHWRNFGIAYRPGQYLRVRRVDPVTNRGVKGSARTIWEVFGFFQKSFVATLRDYAIGDPLRLAQMEAMKAERGGFELMTQEHIAYNDEECRWLAQLMEELRRRCQACGILPHTWNGAGKLAAALMRQHKVIRKTRVKDLTPADVYKAAERAYYGGRSETSRCGVIDPLYGHDLNGAYQAAMVNLPCLEHARWHAVPVGDLHRLPASWHWLARVKFFHPKGAIWCGLPFREPTGGLKFPRMGIGTYWGCEIRAAERLGCRVTYLEGWELVPGCEEKPLAFINDVYRDRMAMEQTMKGSGIPLKLGGNSVYGKLAQRIGAAPYRNPVWAGMITAQIRAWILDALSLTDPANVVYVATDGIFTTVPLPVPAGTAIGEWSVTNHGAVLMVMPGIYWELESGEPMVKTRGMPRERIREASRAIEAVWSDYGERLERWVALQARDGSKPPWRALTPFPSVEIEVPGFVGLRLAWAQGDLSKAGHWTGRRKPEDEPDPDAMRRVSFKWYMKRQAVAVAAIEATPLGLNLTTLAQDGSYTESFCWEGEPNKSGIAQQRTLDDWWLESQPDNIDPFTAMLMGAQE